MGLKMGNEKTKQTKEKVTEWHVNGLTYTKMGLAALFIWLLWGDFCFTLMEQVKPRVLPLYLMGKAGGLNASNSVTNLMMYIIPGITGIVIGPIVSFKSDRYRSKRGRRIPFITWTAPFLVMALVGIGFAPQYKAFFTHIGGLFGLSPRTLTLLTIGFFVALFHFMDEFVNSVFWYLFADVVPEEFLGRFLAIFRIVGAGAAAIFNFFIFPHAETSMHLIFVGAGMIYLFGFGLMCLRVKEGEYPPPDDIGDNPTILDQIKIYIQECFGHRIYWLMFAYRICLAFAISASAGAIIFNRDGIGLSLTDIGRVSAIAGILIMVVQYPAGWAVDKFHPLRITLMMKVPVIIVQLIAFFYLRDLKTFILLEGLKLIFFTLHGAADVPMMIMLFPRDKYGQFCSCNGLMKASGMMLGAILAGIFMDYMTNFGADKFAYRWMYIWTALWQLAGISFLVGVYIIWKKRGGADGYTAPGSAREKEQLATI